jgi:hypothetical protein
MVTQRSDDVNEHNRGKQVSKNICDSSIHWRTERSTVVTIAGTSTPSRSLVMGTRNVVATIHPVSETMNIRT